MVNSLSGISAIIFSPKQKELGNGFLRHYVRPLTTTFLITFFVFAWGCFHPAFAVTTTTVLTEDFLGIHDERLTNLLFGLFIGIITAASAYLFFIWMVMRDRGQIFLLGILMCLGGYMITTNGVVMNALGITNATARIMLTDYMIILSCISSLAFSYYFLELDIFAPGTRYPLMLMGIFLLGLLFYSIHDHVLVSFILPAVATVAVVGILISGLIGFRNQSSGSLVHIIAFIFFLVGTLSTSLYDLGWLSSLQQARNMTNLAFAFAALMFAIVIASQFAARQEEKERALQISNERFMLATRGANEGLFDWNLSTGEVFFSDQFRKIIGVRLDNAAHGLKTWTRMIVSADRRIIFGALRRFRSNQQTNTINIEYRIAPQGSERRWLHSKAVATRDPLTHKVIRLVGSTSDITARKQSEFALRASEARFRSITEAHPVPVMIVALNNATILYASPGSEPLLGISQDQMVGQFFALFMPDENLRSTLWREIASGHDVNVQEITMLRADRQPIEIAISARRVIYQGEDAMVMGLYDLTERRRAEAQIQRQQEALQQSEKMAALGGLLAGVAHELNNPLSVVVGQATLLMEGSPEPKVATRAEKIFKAADRCARIVKSFLALARRKPPERKPVDLNQVIRGSLELLGYQIRNADIKIETDLTEPLPMVTGDGDQLTQVITNLVLNATQAMDGWQGQHHIRITTRPGDSQNVSLIVQDTGPGIPQEIKTKVFEPFFTTKGGKGGTGVGLSLCLNIIASHDGQLQLGDTPGGGATFSILLPKATAETQNSSGETTQDTSINRKIRLLLVDDEVEISQTLADLLEPEGHMIDIAANGAIGLEKLRKGTYDAIISDLRMPVMDGPALYEALKAELPQYLTRIIYVTGDTLSSHVQTFISTYPVPVVEKPYRLQEVKRTLAEIIQKNPTLPSQSAKASG